MERDTTETAVDPFSEWVNLTKESPLVREEFKQLFKNAVDVINKGGQVADHCFGKRFYDGYENVRYHPHHHGEKIDEHRRNSL